jgi:hypothetical protein
MSKRRFHFSDLTWVLGILAGTVFFGSVAFSDSSSSKHYSVLSSALTSKEEFIEQLSQVGIKPEMAAAQGNFGNGSINQDLGASERVTFFDRSDQIRVLPQELGVLKGQGGGIFLREVPTDPYTGVQLDLSDVLDSIAPDWDPSDCRAYRGSSARNCDKANGRLHKAFEEQGFFDPRAIMKAQIIKLEAQYASFVSGKLSAADFSHWILNHPKVFANLPLLLERARSAGNQAIAQTLREITAKALLLVLDAVVPAANSQSPTYPFYDEIVSSDSLLSVAQLYDKLKTNGGWPQVTDLSIQDRQNLGGIYTNKIGDRWKVKGFYLENQNQVSIDLENNFYENVFVYYHELWHVAWSHSTQYKDQIVAVQTLLKDPDSDDNRKAIREATLKFISTNEFLAIDQQVKLFHAAGFESEDWNLDTTASALAWHDSYIGKDAYRLLIPMKDRGNDWLLRSDPRWVLILPLGVNEINKEGLDGELRNFTVWKFKKTFDENYWRNQLATHSELFEKRYFGEILSLANEIKPVSPLQVVQTSGAIYIPVLSCSDIARIRKALGDAWRFGFPFEHSISDLDNCPFEKQENANGGVGTDGSHPGVDGSHPDIDAFPSLEGPGSK